MNRPLAPQFLKDLDNRHLQQKPNLYASRLLWVLYYGGLFAAVITFLSLVLPMELREGNPELVMTTISSILSILFAVVFIIYYLRFNTFKNFSTSKAKGNAFKNLLYLWLCFIVIISIVFIPAYIASKRTQSKYPNASLVQDVNDFNLITYQNNRAAQWEQYQYDSIIVKKNAKDDVFKKYQYKDEEIVDSFYEKYVKIQPENMNADDRWKSYFCLSKDSIQDYLATYDSTSQINDSVYCGWIVPDVQCLDVDFYNSNLPVTAGIGVVRNFENHKQYNDDYNIYNHDVFYDTIKDRIALNNNQFVLRSFHIINHPQLPDSILKNSSKINEIIMRYLSSTDINSSYYSDESAATAVVSAAAEDVYSRPVYSDSIRKIYNQISDINSNLNNIMDNKVQFNKDRYGFFLITILFSFSIAILLWLYRHTTIKTYALSYLAGIIISILFGLIVVSTRMQDYNIGVFYIIVALLVFCCSIFYSPKFKSAIQGIAICLSTVSVPLIPFIAFATYISIQRLHEVEYFNTQASIYHRFILEFSYIPTLLFALVFVYFYTIPKLKSWFAKPEL
jgi:hypothetical protein